jgi:hypothetical protein
LNKPIRQRSFAATLPLKFHVELPMFSLGVCVSTMTTTAARTILAVLALMLFAFSARAQANDAGKLACSNEIPVGVRVVKLPAAELHNVAVSDFALSTGKDGATYNLAMEVKNGTADWCITSFTLAYKFQDARGQEWTAYEYPAVTRFTTKPATDPAVKPKKPIREGPKHSVGLSPGQDESRVVFDVYDYIQPRPLEIFDGFHLTSGEIKSCLGYMLTKSK